MGLLLSNEQYRIENGLMKSNLLQLREFPTSHY